MPGDVVSLKDDRVYINGKQLDEPYVRVVNGQKEPTQPSPPSSLVSAEPVQGA